MEMSCISRRWDKPESINFQGWGQIHFFPKIQIQIHHFQSNTKTNTLLFLCNSNTLPERNQIQIRIWPRARARYPSTALRHHTSCRRPSISSNHTDLTCSSPTWIITLLAMQITYRQTSSIWRTWTGNKIVDHSLICSWTIAYQHCSNYIFILDLTPGFNGLDKGNCKTRRKTCKLWGVVPFILEI